MSGGARNCFDGQQWREELIRKRTKEALAVWPQAERYLHFNEEYKHQTAIYEQERVEKLRARKERNAQREKKRGAPAAPVKPESESPFQTVEERRPQDAER